MALWPGMQGVTERIPDLLRSAMLLVQSKNPFRYVDGHRECFINVTKTAVKLVG